MPERGNSMALTGKEINAIEALNERVNRLEQTVNTLNDRVLRDFSNILKAIAEVIEEAIAEVRDARQVHDA